MIHHTEAVPHRRIALARTLQLPSRLRLEELVVTRPVLARADRPIGTHMAEHEIGRSEDHTAELQSLMRISYAVFCLKKTNLNVLIDHNIHAHTTHNRQQNHITIKHEK